MPARKTTKKAAKKAPARGLIKKKPRPRMSAETRAQLAKGKKLTIVLKKGTTHAGMIKEIKRRLIIDPGIVNPGGCLPCHSGVPFTVIGEELVNPR